MTTMLDDYPLFQVLLGGLSPGKRCEAMDHMRSHHGRHEIYAEYDDETSFQAALQVAADIGPHCRVYAVVGSGVFAIYLRASFLSATEFASVASKLERGAVQFVQGESPGTSGVRGEVDDNESAAPIKKARRRFAVRRTAVALAHGVWSNRGRIPWLILYVVLVPLLLGICDEETALPRGWAICVALSSALAICCFLSVGFYWVSLPIRTRFLLSKEGGSAALQAWVRRNGLACKEPNRGMIHDRVMIHALELAACSGLVVLIMIFAPSQGSRSMLQEAENVFVALLQVVFGFALYSFLALIIWIYPLMWVAARVHGKTKRLLAAAEDRGPGAAGREWKKRSQQGDRRGIPGT